jgi:hypothetical protein
MCAQLFPNWKENAIRHCKKQGCDEMKLQQIELMKLCCGRYVTQQQVEAFFSNTPPAITQQFNYEQTRKVLEPFLPVREKNDHTYTHMFHPLIAGCVEIGRSFLDKIKADYVMMTEPTKPNSEVLLVSIHEMAEKWIRHYASKNILMVPGNLRAGLQTFEGQEVNDVNQKTTYTMQHDPSTLLIVLKKMLSYSYRRGMFSERGFNAANDFEVAYFLKDLLLETPPSVAVLPFLAEFGLMCAFRVNDTNSDKVRTESMF